MTDNLKKSGTVLVVDETPENIEALQEALKDEFNVIVVNDGEQALSIALSVLPDAILLDIMMPGMDGYEVCSRLKQMEATRTIPVIFLASFDEITDEGRGFEVGCVDYLTMPISPSLALARVKTHTALRQARLELQEWNSNLKRKVIKIAGTIREKNQELKEMQEATSNTLISAFSSLLETIDARHFTHAKNVHKLVSEASKIMSLNFSAIRDISLAALLHDIGKLGMGEHLVGRLPHEMSDSYLREYNQHPQLSQVILGHSELLKHVALMIRHHHEAFDGSGFPDGLKGEEIPLGAQLIGIADFIDNTAQSVKEGQAEYALNKLSLCAGSLFNPQLIAHFHRVVREVYCHDQCDVEALIEGEVPLAELVAGMYVTRDFVASNGVVLVKKGARLDVASIATIQNHASGLGVCVDLSNWE
jgi:putative two-component system response regulator